MEDDIELEDGLLQNKNDNWVPPRRKVSDGEAIQFRVNRYPSIHEACHFSYNR